MGSEWKGGCERKGVGAAEVTLKSEERSREVIKSMKSERVIGGMRLTVGVILGIFC